MVPGVAFGLLLHTRHWIRGERGSAGLEPFWETAERAEADGYDHLWTGDSPRIAALRNPVLLAHSLATLDAISSGRLVVGVSVAPQYPYAEQEFAACGVPFGERAGRLEESIRVMRRLWTEESFAFEGRYYRFPEIGIQPRPAGPVPIWIAAGDNEKALGRVARLGDEIGRAHV